MNYATWQSDPVFEGPQDTPFVRSDFPNVAKECISAFKAAFNAPACAVPLRSGFLIIDAYALAGFKTFFQRGYNSLPFQFDQGLFYYLGDPLQATFVSTDVLRNGAPSLWHFCFGTGTQDKPERMQPNRSALLVYLDSLVTATYVASADFRVDLSAERNDDIFDDDEGDVRAVTLKALNYVQDFMGWTDEEMASAGNFGRSSIYNWERGTRPQAAKVAGLLAIDSLLKALRRRLGDDGTRTWLNRGNGTRRERLLEGDYASLLAEAEAILFPAPASRNDEGYWGSGEEELRPLETH